MALFRGAGALRLLVDATVAFAFVVDSLSSVSRSLPPPPMDAARFLLVARSFAAFMVSSLAAVEDSLADLLFSLAAS